MERLSYPDSSLVPVRTGYPPEVSWRVKRRTRAQSKSCMRMHQYCAVFKLQMPSFLLLSKKSFLYGKLYGSLMPSSFTLLPKFMTTIVIKTYCNPCVLLDLDTLCTMKISAIYQVTRNTVSGKMSSTIVFSHTVSPISPHPTLLLR